MDDTRHVQPMVHRTKGTAFQRFYALLVPTIILLGSVVYLEYLIRAQLQVFGWIIYYGLIGITISLVTAGIVIPLAYAGRQVRALFQTTATEIGEFGTVMQGVFGQRTLLAPMTINYVKPTSVKNKVKVIPEVPTITELIETGVITPGQMIMIMGYEQGKGGLIPAISAWPGTFAVAGEGRSGKTRRVLSLVFQAVMGGARVFICDPHMTKSDGLGKMLTPLANWITIAEGHEQIMHVTRLFNKEMENRIGNQSQDRTPWVIVYDEWSRLVTKTSEDDRAVLVDNVESCSKEYAGYYGFAGIIGQAWTEDEAGGTKIRRCLHKVFCHRLNAEYAKFFFRAARWQRKAEELAKRECIYREETEVKVVLTITVPDDAVDWFADWLTNTMSKELPAHAQQLQIAAPHTRKFSSSVTEIGAAQHMGRVSLDTGTTTESKENDVSTDPSHIALGPVRHPQTRLATLTDAIEVWNEGGGMGRPRLREELQARGLDCSDDRAKTLIKAIRSRIENSDGAGGAGTESEAS